MVIDLDKNDFITINLGRRDEKLPIARYVAFGNIEKFTKRTHDTAIRRLSYNYRLAFAPREALPTVYFNYRRLTYVRVSVS